MAGNEQNNTAFTRAQQVMEQFCAYRDRCTSEVERRLRDFELPPEQQELILADLKELGYLDDARFAVAFVRGKFRIKKWGRLKIRAALQALRIPAEFIRQALAQIEEQEYQGVLMELAEKKYRTLGGATDWKRQQQLVRYLLQRGFESDLVLDQVKSLTINRK